MTDRRATADACIDAVGVAREAYERFQEAWREVGRVMRALDEWQWQRVDAYPGWDGMRDVGAGVDMLGWITEVEERADEIRSETDEPSASALRVSDTVAGDEHDRALYDDVMAELARGTHVGNLDGGLSSARVPTPSGERFASPRMWTARRSVAPRGTWDARRNRLAAAGMLRSTYPRPSPLNTRHPRVDGQVRL